MGGKTLIITSFMCPSLTRTEPGEYSCVWAALQGEEAKYGIILKTFLFVWLVEFLKKKRDKFKFSWLALLFKPFSLKKIAQNEWTRKYTTKNLWFA